MDINMKLEKYNGTDIEDLIDAFTDEEIAIMDRTLYDDYDYVLDNDWSNEYRAEVITFYIKEVING